MVRRAPVLSILLVVAGCTGSADRPLEVIGKSRNSSERFQGIATISKNGSTAVKMVSGAGVECIGDFSYAVGKKSVADLICTDGRIAKMTFTGLSRTSGYAYGSASDGSEMAFFFGLPESEADAYLGILPTN